MRAVPADRNISGQGFSWFLGEFDPDKQGFDMEKAKKEISDYRMDKAVISATPAPAKKQEEEESDDLALVVNQ